ncbi:MAG: hypothetical protein L0312_14155, partial [Acidobacteria bacterium]|nr:hypothetical protein [Acidobacteriota bacterium]
SQLRFPTEFIDHLEHIGVTDGDPLTHPSPSVDPRWTPGGPTHQSWRPRHNRERPRLDRRGP